MFKLGIKAYTCQVCSPGYLSDILRYIETGQCHYVELYLNPGTIELALKKTEFLNGLSEVVIHAPTRTDGLNLGVPEQMRTNQELLKDAFHLADCLNATKIIVHPGKNHVIGETVRQLKAFRDERLLLENIPPHKSDITVFGGTLPEEIQFFQQELGCGFVFDIPHAITSANAFELPLMAILDSFSRLNPSMFHFYDGDIGSMFDTHEDLGYGNYPLEELLKYVGRDGMVTLETTKSSMSRLLNCVNNIEVMHYIHKKIFK